MAFAPMVPENPCLLESSTFAHGVEEFFLGGRWKSCGDEAVNETGDSMV
jgi:hypothetical protein